jgi:6-phosphogluconolactonase (cycloisomerase 2 family)
VGAGIVLCPAVLPAQQFIYTNDNLANQTNSTTALKVNKKGAVKVIKTYSTGGKSTGSSSYFALVPLAVSRIKRSNCLFVSNGGDSTIAAFTITASTGRLRAVKGSPFSDGDSGGQRYGIGLAVGANRLLFAGNSSAGNISVLKISPTCALEVANTYAVAGSPDGMKVTPNGKYLIVSYLGLVDSFQIDYTKGELTELGPFSPKGAAAGVDISCDSTTAYFGDAASHTQVEAFSISSSGELAELNNFTNSNGQNSNNVLLSADRKKLYVSNTQSGQVTVLKVGSHGALTYSRTVNLKGKITYTLGLGTNRRGTGIVVAEESNTEEAIGVLAAKGTALEEVPGSPFAVLKNGGPPAGLIAVPTKVCK